MSTTPDVYELIARALSIRPRGIMTDIDGTISRIAGHPDAALVEPEASTGLSRLAAKLDLVAAVSGRSAEDARAMVGSDEMVYAGNHGMELWRTGQLQRSRLAAEHVPRVEELLNELRNQISIEGVYFENKDLTASVHVRGTFDPDTAEAAILDAATRLASEFGLRVTRGRMVIEIRPPVNLSKGTAVIDLVEDYQLRGLIFFGDDMTDVDAFKALRGRREETGDPLYSVGVLRDQTPPEIRETADALVNDVDGVIDALTYAAKLVEDADTDPGTR